MAMREPISWHYHTWQRAVNHPQWWRVSRYWPNGKILRWSHTHLPWYDLITEWDFIQDWPALYDSQVTEPIEDYCVWRILDFPNLPWEEEE